MLKLYPSWFVFFLTLVFGILLVFRSDNWFIIWIGFELSLLGFMPMFTGALLVVEGLVKYFLTQASGSRLFMISFILNMDLYRLILLMRGMSMKIGVFPFYQWVPMVITSLSWGGCLLLSTVQKLSPILVLIVQRDRLNSFILISGVLSILVSGVLGYNQSYIRSLMAYSSISHTGWLLCAIVMELRVFLLYLFVYYYLTVVLFFWFSKNYTLKIVSGSKNFKSYFLLSILMLTMSGIPPFSIFFLKALVVYCLLVYPIIAVFVIFGSMLSIYYYLTFVVPRLSRFWTDQEESVFYSNWFIFHVFISVFLFPFLLLL